MQTATTPFPERIARVLAAHELSRNGDGTMGSAGRAVDDTWPDHVDAAIAVLKTLREPTEAMVAAGDGDTWERMVLTALGEDAPA